MKVSPDTPLADYFAEYIAGCPKKTRSRFSVAIRYFARMLRRAPCLSDLAEDVDTRFSEWLVKRGYKPNTVGFYWTSLRMLWLRAVENGDVAEPPGKNPVDKPIAPDKWHLKPPSHKNKPCPICRCSGHVTGEHRLANPSESKRRYLKRKKVGGGWEESEVGALFVRRVDRMPYGPTAKVKQTIARATAMLAAGKTMRDIAGELDVTDSSLRELRAKYFALWQRALDNAMAAMVEVVQAQAGTVDVLDDPAAYLAKANAASKWAMKNGHEFLPVRAGTLREFYETYYKPVRLTDVCAAHVAYYGYVVRLWALFTGDPPLKDITAATLSTFRECLKKLRGRKPINRAAPSSVRAALKCLQAILDKAGPPERRNRDAAGLIERVPWIKPPSVEQKLPRIVPVELLNQLYAGLVAADIPRIDGFKPPAWWRALVVLAYNTGLRRGTLFKLRMADVDWERRSILVRPSANKSRKLFAVHLNEAAYQHLLAIRTDRELVFPWPFCQTHFDTTFYRLQYASGIPRAERFGLHALRRTLATALYESSPGAAQIALGHSDSRTTRVHYVAPNGIVARALDALPQPEAFTGRKGDVA